MADTAENDAARLVRIRRSVDAAIAGTDPAYRAEREDLFRVADVLWLLTQMERVIPPGSGASTPDG